MIKITGKYYCSGRYGRPKVWGFVSKPNLEEGTVTVRFPYNPPECRYSEMLMDDIKRWNKECLIWKG